MASPCCGLLALRGLLKIQSEIPYKISSKANFKNSYMFNYTYVNNQANFIEATFISANKLVLIWLYLIEMKVILERKIMFQWILNSSC